MNTSTTLRRAGLIRHILLPIAVCAFTARVAQGSDGGDHAEILSLSKASDGEHVVFQVAIRRPDDVSTMTIEASPWRTHRTVWPRVASLIGDPLWEYPCYLEYERPERWQPVPRLDRLVFVGRCPKTGSVKLTLRYPISEGRLKDVPVELDLGEADALTGKPSPRQRWAVAQAEWLRLLGRHAGDVGGFWTYAAEQTHRKFDLPKSEAPRMPFRRFRSPEELQYAVLSGALAIQESMQLDRMVNTDRDREERETPFARIPAVTVKSHPFDEMRGD